MIRELRDIQGLLRAFLQPLILPGDKVMDATAGLGRDTLFLAECVGPTGKVYALDIQEQALAGTRRLLSEKGMAERVSLHCLDHARCREVITERLRAVIFNLGYLPGSDHTIVTLKESTIKGMAEALILLQAGGLLVLTVYRGHAGAADEAKGIQEFLKTLPKQNYSVLEGRYINQGNKSPYWIMVQKNREG
ncbi:MAG TPA: class I SAM-dependent methyltransferase [Desulfitobacteriaceae bacterium]|jgi:tRNA G37 N-methylase Trm5|nr:class I SAM-dependent methyltransferase [Desulfitobacteriaceae bacterium]